MRWVQILARYLFIITMSALLSGCYSQLKSIRGNADLEQSQRFFETGFYKRTMRQILPLACDGNPQAQYAVGYMYYYGLGVAQDTDVGYFWISRAAKQGFLPAVRAADLINRGQAA